MDNFNQNIKAEFAQTYWRAVESDLEYELLVTGLVAYAMIAWWLMKLTFSIAIIVAIFLLTQGVVSLDGLNLQNAHAPTTTEAILAFIALILVMKRTTPYPTWEQFTPSQSAKTMKP